MRVVYLIVWQDSVKEQFCAPIYLTTLEMTR